MDYVFNEGAEKMAEGLISKYHPHLVGIKIAYLFKQRDDPSMAPKPKRLREGRRFVLGKARRVTKIYQPLLDQHYEFVIEFDRDQWQLLALDQQVALVDHELSHCGVDVQGCYMKQHDIEEFRGVVERHGLWKDDIKPFVQSAEQQRQQALDFGGREKSRE